MFVVLVNLPVCAPISLRLLSGPPFSSEAALQEELRLLVAAGVLCAVGVRQGLQHLGTGQGCTHGGRGISHPGAGAGKTHV